MYFAFSSKNGKFLCHRMCLVAVKKKIPTQSCAIINKTLCLARVMKIFDYKTAVVTVFKIQVPGAENWPNIENISKPLDFESKHLADVLKELI